MNSKLEQIRKTITPLFKQYGVIRADVFGSVARGDATQKSDLDLVITLRKPIGIFKLHELNDKLETKLKTKVDLLTHQSIPSYLKSHIQKDKVQMYEER